jgi:hypothetical protein
LGPSPERAIVIPPNRSCLDCFKIKFKNKRSRLVCREDQWPNRGYIKLREEEWRLGRITKRLIFNMADYCQEFDGDDEDEEWDEME